MDGADSCSALPRSAEMSLYSTRRSSPSAGVTVPGKFGSLHVVTTKLKAGYLRANGVPYSDAARVTEDFDFRTEDDGTEWFTVSTTVEDPKYLSAPFVTSTDFRKEADGSKWSPTSCAAY